MNNKLIGLVIFFCSLAAFAAEIRNEEGDKIEAGLQRWRDLAKNPNSLPAEDILPTLATGLRKTSHSRIYRVGPREEVHLELRKAIMSIPNYAQSYQDQMRKDEILRKEGRKAEAKGTPLWDFETLALLPGPETVRALGSFLDDEEGRIPEETLLNNPNADVAPIAANALLAGRALANLGLANPPLQKKAEAMDYDDLQPWRLWFAQVQAGTRTFRFEGDPQEYNLSGPVGTPPKVADIGKVDRETSAPASAPPAAVESEQNKIPTTAIAIACGLLAAAIAFLIRQKKKRAA